MNSVYTLNIKNAQRKTDTQQQTDTQEAQELAVKFFAATFGLLIGPLVVWAAWNMCIPALFGLPAIGYIKSLALYILIKVLK